MGTYEDEAPRLSEIGRMIQGMDRKIDDFRGEVRAALNDKVSKEVYNAERAADRERISNLESRARSTLNGLYGGFISVAVGMILFWIQTRGG